MDATLIYPHQLFRSHPAIAKGREIYLIEDPLLFGNDPHWPAAMHRQKLMLHRASMQAYTTKPYISGSNYILKMSDEPKGPWCQVWDGLFWTFIGDHLPFFFKNPRLAMMARSWEKMDSQKQARHRREADGFLAGVR